MKFQVGDIFVVYGDLGGRSIVTILKKELNETYDNGISLFCLEHHYIDKDGNQSFHKYHTGEHALDILIKKHGYVHYMVKNVEI
jgi:hypothetical protein